MVHSSTLRSGFGLQGIELGGGLFWTWFHTQTEHGAVIYGSVASNIESKDKALSLTQQKIIVLSSGVPHTQ